MKVSSTVNAEPYFTTGYYHAYHPPSIFSRVFYYASHPHSLPVTKSIIIIDATAPFLA